MRIIIIFLLKYKQFSINYVRIVHIVIRIKYLFVFRDIVFTGQKEAGIVLIEI